MNTPETFVSILRQSTLTLEDQVHVLQMLQNLEFAEIEKVAKILKKDAKQKQKILSSLESKQEKLMIQLESEFWKRFKKEEKASKTA